MFFQTGIGQYWYENGDRYEGEFVDDRLRGKGIYYHVDGDRYEGKLLQN